MLQDNLAATREEITRWIREPKFKAFVRELDRKVDAHMRKYLKDINSKPLLMGMK